MPSYSFSLFLVSDVILNTGRTYCLVRFSKCFSLHVSNLNVFNIVQKTLQNYPKCFFALPPLFLNVISLPPLFLNALGIQYRQKNGFQNQNLIFYSGQKYCRMLQGDSAILSTFIKLPFVIKIFVLSIFE